MPRITRRRGWAVLNGDDPRVYAMRSVIRARPWVFSRDPNSPAIRETLDAARPRHHRHRRLGLGAAAGSRPRPAGRARRRPDDPGRPLALQRREHPGRRVGRAGRRDPARDRGRGAAYVPAGRRAQPRPDEPLHASRSTGGEAHGGDRPRPQRGGPRGAAGDHGRRPPAGCAAAARPRRRGRPDRRAASAGSARSARWGPTSWPSRTRSSYLRGRTLEELEGLLRDGAERVGVTDVTAYPTPRWTAWRRWSAEARPGDVVGLMCHAQREEVYAWISRARRHADTPHGLGEKVRAAQV